MGSNVICWYFFQEHKHYKHIQTRLLKIIVVKTFWHWTARNKHHLEVRLLNCIFNPTIVLDGVLLYQEFGPYCSFYKLSTVERVDHQQNAGEIRKTTLNQYFRSCDVMQFSENVIKVKCRCHYVRLMCEHMDVSGTLQIGTNLITQESFECMNVN